MLATAAGVTLSRGLSLADDSQRSASNKALRVCLLSGCPTYNSEKSLGAFQPWLEQHYHVKCTRASRKATDNLQGLEHLETCDVALVFFKRMQLRGEQLERFQQYCLSGRPIVAVRTASHAVQTWLEFDRKVLGGNYGGHYEKGPVTQITYEKAGKSHPILAGVTLKTAPGPLYKNTGHAKDIQVLMTGSIAGHTEPIAWARNYKGARIFYTSLGNVETFAQEDFRQMIANALFWSVKRKPGKKGLK
jgi:hypothetical protein